jgi:DtxR family transcriptional regulator, Mn-dependent transcriptional regulator
MSTITRENYLKAIYHLLEHSPDGVNTNAIAERLETKAATVTDMLKKLAEQNLINYRKYYGVTLTEEGKSMALRIIRSHRLWEVFLVKYLNYGWDEVHDIAEQLEHIRSETLTNRLSAFLNHPHFDPHGDPIPDENGVMVEHHHVPLNLLKIQQKAKIAGVANHTEVFLKYLRNHQIQINSLIEVLDIEDFDGSVTIRIAPDSTLRISRDAAVNLLVSPIK